MLTARKFIIATGSRPAIPDIPGLKEAPYDIDTPRDLPRLKQTHPALLEGIVEMEAVP